MIHTFILHYSSVVEVHFNTYCDVLSHKLWNFIISWVNNNVEGHIS